MPRVGTSSPETSSTSSSDGSVSSVVLLLAVADECEDALSVVDEPKLMAQRTTTGSPVRARASRTDRDDT